MEFYTVLGIITMIIFQLILLAPNSSGLQCFVCHGGTAGTQNTSSPIPYHKDCDDTALGPDIPTMDCLDPNTPLFDMVTDDVLSAVEARKYRESSDTTWACAFEYIALMVVPNITRRNFIVRGCTPFGDFRRTKGCGQVSVGFTRGIGCYCYEDLCNNNG